MKHLEEQLQSWTLRQPSADLKGCIFGQGATKESTPREWLFPWLGPVTACCLAWMAFIYVNSSRPFAPEMRNVPLLFAFASSNATGTVWLKQDFAAGNLNENIQWNVWSKTTFEWTNQGVSSSSNGSLGLVRPYLLLMR
jgi:hypothetical protein